MVYNVGYSHKDSNRKDSNPKQLPLHVVIVEMILLNEIYHTSMRTDLYVFFPVLAVTL